MDQASTSAAPAAPAAAPLPWLALAGVLLSTFISTLSGRLSTFGLNDIRGAVHAGFDEGAWITTAQTVAQMFVAPIAIWMGAVYGTRRMLFFAALAFAAISLFKPLCTDLGSILALQFGGGVASGFFVPLTVGFILRSLPPKQWAYGIAVYALNLELSLNISASLEGWYAEHLSWRWIFWQDVPLALGMAACLFFSGTFEALNPKPPRADMFGLATSGIGLALMYAALDQGNRLDWFNSGLVTGLMLSGLLLMTAFFINEAIAPCPLINLKTVFTQPMPRLFLMIGFLRLTILSTAFVIPQFLGTVRGFRSLETGQTLIWIAVPQLLVCVSAALLLRRLDARFVASLGFVLICTACLLVAHRLTPIWGWSEFLLTQLIQAVGQSFALTGIIFYGVLNLRPQDALTFGAMSQVARLMGGEIGQGFIVTFIRKHTQTASNLIGLHVQAGADGTVHRLRAYAGATARAGDAASGTARGARLLGGIVHSMATTQAIIDSFVAIAAFTALAMLVLATCKAAPQGPASPRSWFADRAGKLAP
jgi:DHA2 family multidrug resistance protein